MRILAAGQLAEDVDQYNRIHEVMHILIAKESRLNDAAEAIGMLWDDQEWWRNNINAGTWEGVRDNITVLFQATEWTAQPEQADPTEICTHHN